MRMAECHSDRQHKAFGLCRTCYNRRHSHTDKCKRYRKEYQKRADRKAYMKAYIWRDYIAERARKRARDYYKKYTAKCIARSMQYEKDHPEIRKSVLHARRVSPGKWKAKDLLVHLRNQNYRCYWCCVPLGKDYHVDHVIPFCKGGTNYPDNIRPTCPACNFKKNGKMPMDFIIGVITCQI